MHPSTESLLSFRDGRPLEALIRQHIDHCAQCQSRVARLAATAAALRELPDPAPTASIDFADVRRRADRQRGFNWSWGGAGAVAASLVVAVLAVALLQPPAPLPEQVASAAQTAGATGESELVKLMSQSRQLEYTLQRIPRPAVQNARMANSQAALQEQLSVIDYGLSHGKSEINPEQQLRLWRGRVALMESMIDLRRAEFQAVAL